MLQKIIKTFTTEYNSYSRHEKLFIFFAMICSFCITAEAAITRASANSMFLSAYTVKLFPTAWLGCVFLNFAIVVFYNRFLPRLGCAKMLILSVSAAFTVNTLSAFYIHSFSFLPFFLYLWKDIFVIFMFQQLYSVIHATMNTSRAKYLYGIVFGMGGLGSVVGSYLTGTFAVLLGSEKLLLLTLPFYVITVFSYTSALFVREKVDGKQNIHLMSKESTDVMGGIKLISKSSFLKFILIIVLAMQVASTILDFQFNSFLEKAFQIQDLRTAFLGKFFAIVNGINIFLQFFGGYFLVRLIGLERSHLLIPVILIVYAIGFLFFPTFPFISFYFANIKAFDYSIFGIIKEMLYIPLKVDEKFKAKAIIDVFAYRTAKAIASLIIIGLGFVQTFSLNTMLSSGVIVIFFLWMISVIFLFKHYYKEVDREHLNWGDESKDLAN
jgi:AAA family ATP:ADP antiporter